MSILKSGKARTTEAADRGRRSFFWKLGAGVSAGLASSVGIARAETSNADGEELALRKLHQAYENAMDKGLYDEVIGMFADDAEVVFNGEAFRHRGQGVSRLYREQFRAGKTGKRMESAPGFEIAADQQQDKVEVSPDRLTAKAVFPYSIQVGMPIEPETSLVSMARLHGEGVRTWWEGGMYAVSYVKTLDGRWKVSRLEYKTLSRADYRTGRSYARPLTVSSA
jgi:hypothetical protein